MLMTKSWWLLLCAFPDVIMKRSFRQWQFLVIISLCRLPSSKDRTSGLTKVLCQLFHLFLTVRLWLWTETKKVFKKLKRRVKFLRQTRSITWSHCTTYSYAVTRIFKLNFIKKINVLFTLLNIFFVLMFSSFPCHLLWISKASFFSLVQALKASKSFENIFSLEKLSQFTLKANPREHKKRHNVLFNIATLFIILCSQFTWQL